MRGTSGTLRHTKRSRYRCSLPGLAGFAGLRRTEPEVPRIGSHSTRKRLQRESSTAEQMKKEDTVSGKKCFSKNPPKPSPVASPRRTCTHEPHVSSVRISEV